MRFLVYLFFISIFIGFVFVALVGCVMSSKISQEEDQRELERLVEEHF
jgi:hypothetical protein